MTRYILQVILFSLVMTCPDCSRSDSELIVESLNLEIMDKFESAIPGFNGLLAQVADVDIDSDRNIYVMDSIERHVVILDSTFTATNIVGREGDGPGEIRIYHPQSPDQHLSIGGGYIVIRSDPNLIHIFDAGGNFLKRFTPRMLVCDLDVREDGTVIACSYDAEIPITEYDAEGNVLRQYGRAVIREGMGNDRYPQFNIYNKSTISLLPDDELVTFNMNWFWLGHYHGDALLSEVMIDLGEIVRIAEPTRKNLKIVRTIMKALRSHSPEIINRAAESRPLSSDDFPGMGSTGSISTDVVRDEIWGFFGIWLYQLTADGRILRVFDCEDGGSGCFAIRNGYIVFGAGTSLAAGTVPTWPAAQTRGPTR